MIRLSSIWTMSVPGECYFPLKTEHKWQELSQLFLREKNCKGKYQYPVLGRDKSYFISKTALFWFYRYVRWTWYHQHAGGFNSQHMCYVWWTWFATESHNEWVQTDRFLLYAYEVNYIDGSHIGDVMAKVLPAGTVEGPDGSMS